MNEQLDDIRARRAAITPGVWSASWAWGKSGGVYNAWAEAPFTSGTCLEDVAPQAEADAAFIAAAPGDVDTLLTMVDALTAEVLICHGLLESLTPGGSEFSGWPERCAEWVRERLSTRAQLAAERNMLRAERDALAAQLAQAQRELAAVPVDAIRKMRFDVEVELHGYTNAELDAWLDAEQDAANAAAEMRAPTYNGGCW